MVRKTAGSAEERKAVVTRLVEELSKRYGSGVVTVGSDLVARVPRIPTGVKELDSIIGGGFPVGKIVELFGPENVGKTSLAYRAIAHAQRDGVAWFIDGEGQFDPEWAAKQGVDVHKLVVMRPAPAETALDGVLQAVRMGASIVVLDSVASLEPLKALKKDIDQRSPGAVPLIMAEALRKVIQMQRSSQTCVVFLNQLRDVMQIGKPIFGDAVITPGGRALRHFAHLRIELRRYGLLYKRKGGERIAVGHEVAFRVVKSKISRPWATCRSRFIFGKGFE
jgi:recombination protein RecA